MSDSSLVLGGLHNEPQLVKKQLKKKSVTTEGPPPWRILEDLHNFDHMWRIVFLPSPAPLRTRCDRAPSKINICKLFQTIFVKINTWTYLEQYLCTTRRFPSSSPPNYFYNHFSLMTNF